MHLVVHLRRNAAPPLEPPPLPPPARARRVPSRRRRGRTSPASSENESADNIAHDVSARAEEVVSASEAALAKQYATEVTNMRQYLPDRDDNFILSVLVDCEGNADAAVSKTRDGHYSKRFYEKTRRKALRAAKREIRASDNEAAMLKVPEDSNALRNETPADSPGLHSKIEDAAGMAVSVTRSSDGSSLPKERDALIDSETWRSGLGESNSSSALTFNSISGGEIAAQSAPCLGEMLDSRPTTDGVGTETRKQTSAPVFSAERKQSKKGWSRAKSARWKSVDLYPTDTDSVAAYVTSERVGMRNDALVSRGPSPLTSMFSSCSTGGVNESGAGTDLDKVTNSATASSSTTSFANPTQGIAPQQASIQPLDLASSVNTDSSRQTASAGGDNSVVTAPPIADDDDGWGAFRRMGLPSFGDEQTSVAPAAVIGSGTDVSVDIGDGDEEASRLRDWAMSARTATKYAQQRGV